jgi:hypothetical protein
MKKKFFMRLLALTLWLLPRGVFAQDIPPVPLEAEEPVKPENHRNSVYPLYFGIPVFVASVAQSSTFGLGAGFEHAFTDDFSLAAFLMVISDTSISPWYNPFLTCASAAGRYYFNGTAPKGAYVAGALDFVRVVISSSTVTILGIRGTVGYKLSIKGHFFLEGEIGPGLYYNAGSAANTAASNWIGLGGLLPLLVPAVNIGWTF